MHACARPHTQRTARVVVGVGEVGVAGMVVVAVLVEVVVVELVVVVAKHAEKRPSGPVPTPS